MSTRKHVPASATAVNATAINAPMILMAVVGKPHGVRGLVRITAFTEALANYPLTDQSGRAFSLTWAMDSIAELTEITPTGRRKINTRSEAERLTNTQLFAPRSCLPAAGDEEFYLADLVGLQARSATGAIIGNITAIHDYGGGTSLEISPGAVLVPFTRAAVPVVDVAAGHVVIDPPAEVTA